MPSSPTFDPIGGTDSIIGVDPAELTITGTTDAGTTVALTFGIATPVSATVSGTFWSYTLLGPDITALGQGLGKTITATATDAGGTSGLVASSPFGVETVPPAAPTIDPIGVVGGDTVVSSLPGDAEVTGTTAPGSSVTLLFNGIPLGTATVEVSGSWSYALTGPNLTTLGQIM
jgi:hypothetical protein